ncbi:MAG: hypothetical protein KKA68_21315 [Gammaproteobacteria bacterium]|uniref:Uncharacterized protein n=1 Tax=viral metagenome TaxID=1070528 RepID=A0A6M3IMW2_9ZZZZ|nr:hypothetical protein [Gammaproteobacteria bacterium]
MATIDDLNTSIPNLSRPEAELLIKKLRESRRIPKKKRLVVTRQSKPKISKKPDDLIASLSEKQKQQLLALLEGTK